MLQLSFGATIVSGKCSQPAVGDGQRDFGGGAARRKLGGVGGVREEAPAWPRDTTVKIPQCQASHNVRVMKHPTYYRIVHGNTYPAHSLADSW